MDVKLYWIYIAKNPLCCLWVFRIIMSMGVVPLLFWNQKKKLKERNAHTWEYSLKDYQSVAVYIWRILILLYCSYHHAMLMIRRVGESDTLTGIQRFDHWTARWEGTILKVKLLYPQCYSECSTWRLSFLNTICFLKTHSVLALK